MAEIANYNVAVLGAGSLDQYVPAPYYAPGHEAGAKTAITPEALEFYDSLPTELFRQFFGGNGANMARRAAAEELPNTYSVNFLSVEGDDEASKLIRDDLSQWTRITNSSAYSPDHVSSTAYIEQKPGKDRHIRNVGRTSLGLTLSLHDMRQLLGGSDISIAASVKSEELYLAFAKAAYSQDLQNQAPHRQQFVAMLPGSSDYKDHAENLHETFSIRRPNALFGNETEFKQLLEKHGGAASDHPAELARAAGHLAEHVVVTAGQDGIYMNVPHIGQGWHRASSQVLHIRAVKAQDVKDTTGAGDSVAWSITRDLHRKSKGERIDYLTIMHKAALLGSQVVQHVGPTGDIIPR